MLGVDRLERELLLMMRRAAQSEERGFHKWIATRIDPLPRLPYNDIGLETATFQANAVRGLVVEFADREIAAVRQGVMHADSQHATTGLGANYSDAVRLAQRGDKDLGGTRGSLAREDYDVSANDFRVESRKERDSPGLDFQRYIPMTIRKLPEISCGRKKSRRDLGHGLGIAAAVISQIDDDAAGPGQLALRAADGSRKINRDRVSESVNCDNRDSALKIDLQARVALVPSAR